MKIFSILSNSNMHEYYHLFSLSYLIEYGWIFLLILFIIEYFCYHLTYPSILSNISVTTYPLSYWIFISVTTCPLYFIISMSYYLLYYSIFLHISPYPLTFHITLPITYQNKQTNNIYIYIYEIYKTIFQLSFIPTILYIYYITYFTNTYIHLPLIQKNTKNKHTIYHTIFPLQKITPTYIYIYLSYYIYISSYTIIYILLILLSYHSLSTSSYSQKSESRENHIQQKPTILQNRIEMNRMKKSNTFPILVIL